METCSPVFFKENQQDNSAVLSYGQPQNSRSERREYKNKHITPFRIRFESATRINKPGLLTAH